MNRLNAILDEIDEFLEDQEDVVDGSYGEPHPNKAMSLLMELRQVRAAQPEAVLPALVDEVWNDAIESAAATCDATDGWDWHPKDYAYAIRSLKRRRPQKDES